MNCVDRKKVISDSLFFFFILFLSLFLFPAVLYRVHDHLHSDRAHLVAGPDLEDFK